MSEERHYPINTWEQVSRAGGSHYYITYRRQESRSPFPAGWYVYRLVNGREVATDPENRFWHDRQRKFFSAGRYGGRKEALVEAINWCRAQIGADTEFVRNRHGDYVEKAVNMQFPIPRRDK